MNKLPIEKRVAIISALVEGNSLRSTSRMVGCSINTVTKLLIDVATACDVYQSRVMKNLPCRRLQLDEIWSFCYSKAKNVPEEKRDTFGFGDVWTYVAIDAESKLVPAWWIGPRDGCSAKTFIDDLAPRLTNRIQVSTDGHRMYIDAMESGFGGDVDYAMIVKHYGREGSNHHPETRYSPAECCGTEKIIVSGDPDPAHISTSHVERQNLTMRMRMRRFTRLTNGFSKKLENHCHAVALHFMHYNFVRRHMSLRVTPAMKAGVTDHLWDLAEVVRLADATENQTATDF
jgi:IS1 family transposase